MIDGLTEVWRSGPMGMLFVIVTAVTSLWLAWLLLRLVRQQINADPFIVVLRKLVDGGRLDTAFKLTGASDAAPVQLARVGVKAMIEKGDPAGAMRVALPGLREAAVGPLHLALAAGALATLLGVGVSFTTRLLPSLVMTIGLAVLCLLVVWRRAALDNALQVVLAAVSSFPRGSSP